jgi:hypothetical protein
MSPSSIDDLLRPSLRSDHDAAGFGTPFDPSGLPYVGFFCGPVGAGWLVCRNFRELGMPGAARTWGWVFAVATIVMVAGTAWAIREMTPRSAGKSVDPAASRMARLNPKRNPPSKEESEKRNNTARWVRIGVQAVSVLLAGIAAGRQKTRFRVFTAQYGTAKRLFPSALIAFLVGLPIYGLAVFGAAILWP